MAVDMASVPFTMTYILFVLPCTGPPTLATPALLGSVAVFCRRWAILDQDYGLACRFDAIAVDRAVSDTSRGQLNIATLEKYQNSCIAILQIVLCALNVWNTIMTGNKTNVNYCRKEPGC